MANTLLIEKETGGYYGFTSTIDGVVQDKIRNMFNDAFGKNNLVTINNSTGANLVKKQNISVFDITLIASGTFTFSDIDDFLVKLIDIGFFDWRLGTGGGSGATRFDDLLDTFQYFGQNGKGVRVNESEQKLETYDIYNYRTITDLEDTYDVGVPNKMLVTDSDGNVALEDKITIPQPFLTAVGSFHYADLTTQTTPLTVVANVPLKLTNDAEGTGTNVSNAPYGVRILLNTSTGQLGFGDLSIGDLVTFRLDANFTTTTANQTYSYYIVFAVGSGNEFTRYMTASHKKTTGILNESGVLSFDIENQYMKDYYAEVYIVSDGAGTIKVNDFYFEVIRKNINVIDIDGLTDLSATRTPSNVSINSTTGTPAVIGLGNGTNAGFSFNDYTSSEKAKLADTYIKSEVDAKLVSLYKFKGNVANYASLPSSGQVIGNVWNLTDTGGNYAWTGTIWDELGTTIDISGKENTSNKTATVIGNESSTSLYLNIVGAVTYFQQKLTDSIFGVFIIGLTAKSTPIDADSISIVDSTDSNKAKKTTLTQLKAFLKTYFDTQYPSGSGTSTGTNTGDQDLSGKVTGNTAITGATKTKITYDSKGLITSGADLIESDIPTLGQSKVTNLTIDLALKAPLANPTFTGSVVVPNAATSTQAVNKGQLDAVSLNSALVHLDEGNGIGYVINGRTAANYGNIGLLATDLSFSDAASSVRGSTGSYSFSAGFNTRSSGAYSVAIGNGTIASSIDAFASGNNSVASQQDATAMGGYTAASGFRSMAVNSATIASGYASFAGNESTEARSFVEAVFGRLNTLVTPSSTNAWVTTDRLFGIGNGTTTGSRSDAFIILKNGLTTLPSVTNALITAESTGKAVVTKEYLDSGYVAKGVDNATTGVLTSATLNSTYPNATTGFRVYCASIIVGAMTYEKTPSGWLGFTCMVP